MSYVTGLRTVCAIGFLVIVAAIPVQAKPPMVVLSLKSIDELLDDADFIGEAAGQPGLRALIESNVEPITGGAGKDGIDRERPLGLYWNMVDSDPTNLGNVVLFLPVADEDKLEELVKKFVPDFKSEDGKWTLTVQGMPLYATVSDEYLFVSNSPDGLQEPADPDKIANADYDIAVDVNIASIPKEARESWLTIVEAGARQSMANNPEPESEAEAKGRQLGFDWMLGIVKSVVNDGERMTFGMEADSEDRTASVDLGLTGAPRTSLANAIGVYAKTVPAFAALASDTAPLQLVMSVPTTGILDKLDELIDAVQLSANTEIDKDPKLKDEADKKAARDVARRLLAIAKETIKSGSLHSVMVVDKGDDDTVRFLAGAKVAKGDEAGKLWDDILKLSKESPDLAKVKSDVDKHAAARIHSIAPDLNDKQAAMFGNNPAHLAFRSDSLWLALGGGNLDALKSALDLSNKKVARTGAPISLRVKPASLVTLLETNDEALVHRAEAIAGEPGDIFNIEIVPSGAGVKVHVEFGIDLFGLSGAPVQIAE